MDLKFCPGCAAVLEQKPVTVGGITDLYWVCPEGDWEEPVEPNSRNESAPSGYGE